MLTPKGFEKRTVTLGDIVVNEQANVREVKMNYVHSLAADMKEYDEDANRVGAWQDAWAASGGLMRTVEVNGELQLYGGFHTHRAAFSVYKGEHEVTVLVNVDEDIPEECRLPHLLAGGENVSHGKKRTAKEKRIAVDRWIRCEASEDSWKWSDGYIAKRCNVTRAYVTKRDEIAQREMGKKYTRPEERYYVRNGKVLLGQARPAKVETPEAPPEVKAPEADVDGADVETTATEDGAVDVSNETPEAPVTEDGEVSSESTATEDGATEDNGAEPESEDNGEEPEIQVSSEFDGAPEDGEEPVTEDADGATEDDGDFGPEVELDGEEPEELDAESEDGETEDADADGEEPVRVTLPVLQSGAPNLGYPVEGDANMLAEVFRGVINGECLPIVSGSGKSTDATIKRLQAKAHPDVVCKGLPEASVAQYTAVYNLMEQVLGRARESIIAVTNEEAKAYTDSTKRAELDAVRDMNS